VQDAECPGNLVLLEVCRGDLREMICVIGERQLSAEEVAGKAANELGAYLECGAPIGEYLADQLIIPFSLAGGGSFRATALSQHAKSNIDVVKLFSPTEIECTPSDDAGVSIFFGAR